MKRVDICLWRRMNGASAILDDCVLYVFFLRINHVVAVHVPPPSIVPSCSPTYTTTLLRHIYEVVRLELWPHDLCVFRFVCPEYCAYMSRSGRAILKFSPIHQKDRFPKTQYFWDDLRAFTPHTHTSHTSRTTISYDTIKYLHIR